MVPLFFGDFAMFNWFYSSRSPKWRDIRAKHVERQPYCQGCGSRNNLEVHHIEPYHVNPNRELDPTNLITLCKKCHLTFGHLMDYKSWNVDVIEDCRNYFSKIKKRPYHENFSQISGNRGIVNSIIGWYNRSFNPR